MGKNPDLLEVKAAWEAAGRGEDYDLPCIYEKLVSSLTGPTADCGLCASALLVNAWLSQSGCPAVAQPACMRQGLITCKPSADKTC